MELNSRSVTEVMELDQAFRFEFPIFSYLMEPGPRPGALRDSQSGSYYVPLWTERHLFDEFVTTFEFGGPICGLQINDCRELVDFLSRFDHPAITQAAIDPDAAPWHTCKLIEIADILHRCHPKKPR
jgi:hypothetical protein